MGTSVKKTISEVPELKGRLVENFHFLNAIFPLLVKGAVGDQVPRLNIGASDSVFEVEFISPEQAVLKLQYSVDNDSEAENGRLYIIDRFEFNPQNQSLLLGYSRSASLHTANAYWQNLAAQIQKVRSPKTRDAQLFFEKALRPSIVLPEMIPSTLVERRELENESAGIRKRPEREPKNKVSYIWQKRNAPLPIRYYGFQDKVLASFEKLRPTFHPSEKNILERQDQALPKELLQPERAWMASLLDPQSFVPFLAGSTAYRLSQGFLLGLLGDFCVRREWPLRLFAAVFGIAAESGAFEASARWQHSQSMQGFAKAVFENFKLFSLFHSSNYVWRQLTQNSFWLHVGAWSTLHGVNEWQRAEGILPSEEVYMHRIFEDTAFYLHAGAASAFGIELWGHHPSHFVPQRIVKSAPVVEKTLQKEAVQQGKQSIIEIPKTRVLLRLVNGSMELKGELREEGLWSFAKHLDLNQDASGRFNIAYKPSMFSQDLRVDAIPVKPGEKIFLRAGSLVQYQGRTYCFIVQKPGPLEQSLHLAPPTLQESWSSELKNLESFEALKGFLEKSSLAGSAQEWERVAACLKGKANVDSLSPFVQSKVLEIMEFDNAILAEHMPRGFESTFELDHVLLGASQIEQRYHLFHLIGELRLNIRKAQSVQAVLDAVQKLPVLQLEEKSKREACASLEAYLQKKLSLVDLPIDFGIRQRVADLEEFQFYRQHEAGNARPSYGRDAFFARNMRDLEGDKNSLLIILRSGSLRASAKTYQGLELADLVYEVLERGKPLETVPTEENTRRHVKTYMRKVIDVSMMLFAPEWKRAGERNYLSGEHFGDPAHYERHLQAQYRFARMLLNEKTGLPIFGEPTQREQGILTVFAKSQLKLRGDVQYADAQAAIREHLENFSSAIREGLRGADQEMRALVMETYFGSQQHRIMSDPYRAFEIARYLGELGFYREVGVTMEVSGKRLFTYLSLGDLNSVHPAKDHQYFILHTHPQKYTNRRGETMGSEQDFGRTLALEIADPSLRTLSVLFSGQDVRIFVQHARDIFSEAQREPDLDLSIFYDRQNRIFKNWVQHPQGMSEMKVYLSPTGVPQKVVIEYGVKSEARGNSEHFTQAAYLRALAQELRVPVEVNQVDLYLLESQVPFASP